ncbi:AAA family ATPase [Brachybacterium sp. J144]|uniref:MinD/ParA family ATP-binding protein n=1 Tax=Brachybacterium sp. J144 TaxID=3116487 RepID=UPI002E7621E2|nr:AAA family ATPase [Brachybacterium sp. J144]MEE1652173.1 AAA family ATPase [Brachybacterium sp. J144]
MSSASITVDRTGTNYLSIDGSPFTPTPGSGPASQKAAMDALRDHAARTNQPVRLHVTEQDGAVFHLNITPDGQIWTAPEPEPAPIETPTGSQEPEPLTIPRIDQSTPSAEQGFPVDEHHTFREVQSDVHSSMTPVPQREYQQATEPITPPPAVPAAEPQASDPVDADPRWIAIAQEPATRGFRGTLNGMGLKLTPTDAELAERRESLRQEIAREEETRRADEQLAQEEAVKETRRTARERAAAEQDRAERAVIQTNYGEPKTVGFMNDKGGVGKTTDALCIAAAAGRIRGGDVIAWDANETRGTMGFRALKDHHSRSVVDFLDQAATEFTTVEGSRRTTLSRYTRGQGDNKFAVLASDESRKKQDQVDGEAFRTVHEIVGRFYSLIIVDTGNNHEVSHFKAALAATDQLVIPVSPGEDGAYAAELMLDNFIGWGYGDLVKNAVVLLHDSATQHGDARAIAAKFENRVRAILPVPFDPILDAGGQIDFDALAPDTRAAYQTAAAAISHGLAEHSDGDSR